MEGKSIPVYNDGKQKRAFCYVEDIVTAIIKIQESDITGEVFNIGNAGTIISINDLAHKIKKICHSGSEIIHVDPVKLFGNNYIEAFDKIPNLDKIRHQLGWSPVVDLDNALGRIYQYYCKKYENTIRKPCL
jgi:nucleoside-diphosphate-sugar epimerase